MLVSLAPGVGHLKWTVSPFTAVTCCHLARETENKKRLSFFVKKHKDKHFSIKFDYTFGCALSGLRDIAPS